MESAELLREKVGRALARQAEYESQRAAGGAPRAAIANGPLPARLRKCVHSGGKKPGEPCDSPLSLCVLHGDVTSFLKPCEHADRCCQTCPDYVPVTLGAVKTKPTAALPDAAQERFTWISSARMAADAIALAAILPADCAGIVGCPRSGMAAAGIVATHLHLPLYTLTHKGPVRLGEGRWGTVKGGTGPLAVVEDSSFSGASLFRARQHMGGHKAVFCAVYATPRGEPACDLFARRLNDPHILEWNFANNSLVRGHPDGTVYAKGMGFDLDGIIVHDDLSGGPAGRPYLVPRSHKIRLIATGRHERHRAATESLLRALRVKWERLAMLPDAVPQTFENCAHHKARHYRDSGCGFFVESEPIQAELIRRLTGRAVVCPRADRVFQ